MTWFTDTEIMAMKKSMTAGLLAALITLLFLNGIAVFAHGGEDHGDQKPAAGANVKGTVSHTTHLGEIEVMLKHPELVPDTATSGKLFFTKFQTNEPVDKVTSVIEIEAADGSITQATVEKTDDAGIFSVKIPALPQGTYVVRAKVTTKGETDTATFSGVEVKPEATATTNSGVFSWIRNILIAVIFAVVIAMFGVLVYFVLRFSASDEIDNEAVSA